MNRSFTAAVFYILLSSAGMALIGLFGKIGIHFLSIEFLIFWRFVAGSIFCLLLLLFLGKLHHLLSIGNWKLHILRALFLLGSQYSFYFYIQDNTLLNGLVLLNLGPLFIPLIEWVITRHPIGKSTWAGLILSFIGMLCILQPNKGILSLSSGVGVLAGLCQGCSQVIFGLNVRGERSFASVLSLFLICTLFSLFPYLLIHPTEPLAPTTSLITGSLVIGLGTASVLNQIARAFAYQHSSPSRLATFLYFSILLGGLLDWLVLGAIPNFLSLLGALLVIAGGILKIYLRHRFLQKSR